MPPSPWNATTHYIMHMHRTQLLLPAWQYEALKALAERRGQSLSQVVRELLAEALGHDAHRGVARIEGAADDGEARGRHHDDWLYQRPQRPPQRP